MHQQPVARHGFSAGMLPRMTVGYVASRGAVLHLILTLSLSQVKPLGRTPAPQTLRGRASYSSVKIKGITRRHNDARMADNQAAPDHQSE